MRVYKLVGKTVVACTEPRAGFAGYLERITAIQAGDADPWVVGYTELGGDRLVSTVFLGLDHGRGKGPPLVFETMIFTGGSAELVRRCSTWEEAEALHEETVAGLRRLRVVK